MNCRRPMITARVMEELIGYDRHGEMQQAMLQSLMQLPARPEADFRPEGAATCGLAVHKAGLTNCKVGTH